jgi:23S rRNA (adenine2030-N6)-methyltransferase
LLSYQHGFHAGNFADVHKHLTLQLLLNALNKKSKPWSYLETHSGRGLYDLSSEQAQKTGEFRDGVAKLWGQTEPEALQQYLSAIAEVSQSDQLLRYPGSPTLAALNAREMDKIHLMELHPQEVKELKRNMRLFANVGVHHRDGYEGVLSLLPPKPNRGLLLIDPAYEVKEEYQQVASFVGEAMERWPNGQIAVWYPLLAASRHENMLKAMVRQLPDVGVLDSQFIVAEPQERGMYGSGMLLINPPWQFDQQLDEILPTVQAKLGTEAPKTTLRWLKQAP